MTARVAFLVPFRQWTLSFPRRIRCHLARDVRLLTGPDRLSSVQIRSCSPVLALVPSSGRSLGAEGASRGGSPEDEPMPEPWVSVEDVASHLGVAKDSVYRWIENKGMPAHRVGRLWKFKISEIDEWVHVGGAGGDDDAASPSPGSRGGRKQ